MARPTSEQLMSISAVITAVVAIIIAVYEQHITREHQKLSVEPYLIETESNEKGYQFGLVNNGLGPARIMSVSATVNDKPVSNWNEIAEQLTGADSFSMSTNSLSNGLQLAAGNQIMVMHLSTLSVASKFHENRSKLNIEVCYCSIYKQCWVVSKNKTHVPVSYCETNLQDFY